MNSASVSDTTHGCATASEERVPLFQQNRGLSTVTQLLEEYSQGVNGGRSVKSLEEKWGRQWRHKNTDTKFYCRCVPVYKYYEALKANGKTHAQAVAHLENLRNERELSLPAFKDLCKTTDILNIEGNRE